MRIYILLALLVLDQGVVIRNRLDPDNPAPSPSTPSSVDLSEYRTATYGAPDHYCDPTRSLASSGTGTSGDAWNMNQCQTEPACGDVIGVLNVGAGTPVQIGVPATYQEPAFDPSGITDCTEGNPLVYVARYPAIALTRSSITTDQNRTEIRTSGTREQGDVVGTGRAAYGSYNHDYVIYDGFFVDMAQVGINGDQGIITVRSATGVEFRNFRIKGMTTDMDSNAVVWRPDNTLDTVLSNFEVWDFDNVPTGGGLNQQGLFSDQYGDQNYLIEHFRLENTDRGIFPKGTASGGTVFNYGTIQYGIISGVSECLRMNDFHATNLTTVQYVLCYDWTFSGLSLASETSPPRNLLMHHVTFANGTCSSCAGPVWIRDDTSAVNITIRDNIFDYQNGVTGWAVDAGEATFTFPTFNYNVYYRGGSTVGWAYNGSSYTSIASWRTATGREANSQVLGSDPFTNRAIDLYTITGGHAATTASSTGGQVGAYATSETLGPITS